MNIKGIKWLGSPTTEFDGMKRFLIDVLGLTPQKESEDFAVFDLPNGDVWELFGPKTLADSPHFMRGPVTGFEVDDVDAARREMEAKGILFIGPVRRASGFTWSHFFAPDGHVYELTTRSR